MVLTKEGGEILHEYASSGINLIDTGKKKIMEVKNLMAGGELRIGVGGDTISRYFFITFFWKNFIVSIQILN